jgi:NitT/TauT family transport system ATP-binding protein
LTSNCRIARHCRSLSHCRSSVYVGDRVIVLTPGPGRVRGDLPVHLPEPRDQITTKELPEFVRLRTEVSRLIRGREAASGLALQYPGNP